MSNGTADHRLHPAALAVLGAFFASGVAGLVHEITWTRLLRHVLGNSTFAVTTVLCAFMGGLALGSYLGGRLADRRQDLLRLFAALEYGIGLVCLALPGLISASEPVYAAIYGATRDSPWSFGLLSFVYCSLLLLLPATMMGATLPILARLFTRARERVGRAVGTLYALNTTGAVVGIVAAGFALLPSLGIRRTILVACVLNLAIGTAALLLYLGRALPAAAAPEAPRGAVVDLPLREATGAGRPALAALLLGYGLSGLAALVYEVAWTRVLSLIVGSSTYAFSLMLTAFILGLALGSAAFARRADRVRRPWLVLAAIQVAIGLAALGVVPLFGELPLWATGLLARFGGSFWQLQAFEFALILAVMLVPTTLMGAAFPLASRLFTQDTASVGRSIGALYAANTCGSILGAFAAGFLLIPGVGIQRTLLIASGINVAIGCSFAWIGDGASRAVRAIAVGAAAVVAGACMTWIPEWDPSRMSFGSYVQALTLDPEAVRSPATLAREATRPEILFHREGLTTTVTVKRFPNDVRYLYVNGKIDATSHGNLPNQKLLAHLPLLLQERPARALQIGLASGISLGAAARHPLERIDCAEISPAVVEATRFFESENYRVLDDPRVRVILADGRNHLALAPDTYDAIISQPSNPWIAGIADLFTEEFFRLCRRRLNPGGVACVWIESTFIDETSFRSVTRTFRSVFEHATLWNVPGSADYMLVGFRDPPRVDPARLARRIGEEPVASDLALVRIRSVPDLLANLLTGPAGLLRFAQGAPRHTDDNTLVEFAAPRALLRQGGGAELRESIERYREPDLGFLQAAPEGAAALDELRGEASRRIEAAGIYVRARARTREGRTEEAIELYRRVLTLHPEHVETLNNLGAALAETGRLEEALALFREAVRLEPDDAGALYNLGNALSQSGNPDEAIGPLRRALLRGPDRPATLTALAWVLVTHPDPTVREPQEAIRLAERAARLTDRGFPSTLDVLAAAYASDGRYERAVATAEEALALGPPAGLARSIRDRLEGYRRAMTER